MQFAKAFVARHPFISLWLAEAAISGTVAVVKTIAYAITGREGLKPKEEDD